MKLEMKVDVRLCEKKQESQEKQIEIAPQRVTGGSRKFGDMGCNFLIHSSLQIPDAA